MSDTNMPTANLKPQSKSSLSWLLPVVALLLVIVLGVSQIKEKGIALSLYFDQGHGIKEGDSLKFRGIVIGSVQAVHLDSSLEKIKVEIDLHKKAKAIAKADTQFWIVRPSLGVTGAKGLETIVGARYITLRPGQGATQFKFDGLEKAPTTVGIEPGGLELTLRCERKGSIQPAAPVTYRQIKVGHVRGITLSADASSVEIKIWISAKYKNLIRDNSKFWVATGFQVEAGFFKGLDVNLSSPETLIAGGIEFATPNTPGKVVTDTKEFKLYEKSKGSWLEWNPSLSMSDVISGK